MPWDRVVATDILAPGSLSFDDVALDDDQREAVERAVHTPDILVLDGAPGTGKSRVIAEVIRQSLRQQKRVLFLAASANGIQSVLDRLVAFPDLLALEVSGRRAASSDARPNTSEGVNRIALTDWLPQALKARADRLEDQIRRRRREIEIVEQLLERWDCRATLLAQRDKLLVAVPPSADYAHADEVSPLSPVGTKPQSQIEPITPPAKVRDEELPNANLTATEVAAALSPGPCVEIPKRRWFEKWWPFSPKMERSTARPTPVATPAMPPAVTASPREVGQPVVENPPTVDPVATMPVENGRPTHSSAINDHGGEGSTASGDLEIEEAKLSTLMEELLAELPDEFRPNLAAGRESIVAQRSAMRQSLEVLLEQWSAIRRWLDAELKPSIAEISAVVACCPLVAAPIAHLRDLLRVLKRSEQGRFDLVIVDEAEWLSDRELRRAARQAERCVLVGDSTLATRKSVRSADRPPTTPGRGLSLWHHLVERFQTFGWRHDGDRLCARIRWVPPRCYANLLVEPLMDRPEIELRFAEEGPERRELIEIIFPKGTELPEAARFLYQELGELPIASSKASWSAEGVADRVQFHDGPIAAWHGLADGIDMGWQFTAGGEARIAALRFHKSRGWDRASAESWCQETLRVTDPGRFVRLTTPHRDRSDVMSLAAALGFGRWTPCRRSDTIVAGPCVEFIPVPALPQTSQLHRRGDHGCPLPRWRLPDIRQSAGLEIHLEDPTAWGRLTADQRAKLPQHGYVNPAEAEGIVRLLTNWLDDWPRTPAQLPAEVAILTLEAAQAILIRDMVEKVGLMRSAAGAIRIAWAEEFRQREADIVIVSLVRSPRREWPNFGRDPRTMRCAVTRARDRLILVGDGGALTRRAFGNPPPDVENSEAARQQTAWVSALVQLLRSGDSRNVLVRPGPPRPLGD